MVSCAPAVNRLVIAERYGRMGQRGRVKAGRRQTTSNQGDAGTESARIGGRGWRSYLAIQAPRAAGANGESRWAGVQATGGTAPDRDEAGKRPCGLEEFNLSAVDLAARERAGDNFVEADEMVRDEGNAPAQNWKS